MKKVIRLTESDLMRMVKRVINEQRKTKPKRRINEGIGTAVLLLTGAGLFYLGRKIKKFIDRTAKYMPSVSLNAFLSKIKSIEEGKENGEVKVKKKGNYIGIAIIKYDDIFDSITVDMENNEIYRGLGAWGSRGLKISDRIIPMSLPPDADKSDMEFVETMEEELINGIMSVIANYSEKPGEESEKGSPEEEM